MDELGLVDWLTKRSGTMPGRVRIGPGDDCAVLAGTGADEIVFTTDEVVEGTHFRLSGKGLGPRATGRDVGYKAMIASVSDIAAMGAEPLGAVAAASLRKGQAGRLGKAIHDGLVRAGADCGCPLVGGNVAGTSGPVSVTVSAIGRAPRGKSFLRNAARPGDVIYVTGELGGSALGRHLHPVARLAEARRCRALGGVRAMIDVTDGLALDLWRLARASSVGAEVDADAVPVSAAALRLASLAQGRALSSSKGAARRLARATGKDPLDHALSDGEDYELLFTVATRAADRFEGSWGLETRLSRIGKILPAREGLRLRRGGKVARLGPKGYRHLSGR